MKRQFRKFPYALYSVSFNGNILHHSPRYAFVKIKRLTLAITINHAPNLVWISLALLLMAFSCSRTSPRTPHSIQSLCLLGCLCLFTGYIYFSLKVMSFSISMAPRGRTEAILLSGHGGYVLVWCFWDGRNHQMKSKILKQQWHLGFSLALNNHVTYCVSHHLKQSNQNLEKQGYPEKESLSSWTMVSNKNLAEQQSNLAVSVSSAVRASSSMTKYILFSVLPFSFFLSIGKNR